MLAKAIFRFKSFGMFISVFCLFATTGFSHEDYSFDGSTCYDHGWAQRYLENLDESVPIEEMVDFLVGLKTYLQSLGYEPPSISTLCLKLRDELLQQELNIEEAVFDELHRQIALKENALLKTNNFSLLSTYISNPKTMLVKKEFEVSGKFAIGFTKALGGALLCIVPHPVAWTVGGGLVTSGIIDMMESAEDNSNNENGNFEDRFRTLLPPPN